MRPQGPPATALCSAVQHKGRMADCSCYEQQVEKTDDVVVCSASAPAAALSCVCAPTMRSSQQR